MKTRQTKSKLTLFRRHMDHCPRFLTKPRQRTERPGNAKQFAEDMVCAETCPLTVRGWLEHERKRNADYSLRPIFHSVDSWKPTDNPDKENRDNWERANNRLKELMAVGRIRSEQTKIPRTIEEAVPTYILMKRKQVEPTISEGMINQWIVLLEKRLLPYAKEHGWPLETLEQQQPIEDFRNSWRILAKKFQNPARVGQRLKRSHLVRSRGMLNSFLDDCVDRDWIRKSGGRLLPVRGREEKPSDDGLEEPGRGERFGLEADEYALMLRCMKETPYIETPEGQRAYQRIQELRQTLGIGVERISVALNKEGIPTKWGGKRLWTPNTVRSLLEGKLRQKKFDDLEEQEAFVLAELLRWCGMRISDGHPFTEKKCTGIGVQTYEWVKDENGVEQRKILKKGVGKGDINSDFQSEIRDSPNSEFYRGANTWKKVCHFRQRKTEEWCTVPLPDHVYKLLLALPGKTENGVHRFFTFSLDQLKHRICVAAARAQKIKPFEHTQFGVHRLRHTFVIQLMNAGEEMRRISKWIGHADTTETEKLYGKQIKGGNVMAGDSNKRHHRKMVNESYIAAGLPAPYAEVSVETVRKPVARAAVKQVAVKQPAPKPKPILVSRDDLKMSHSQMKKAWAGSKAGAAALKKNREAANTPKAKRKNAARRRSVTPIQAAEIRRRLALGESRASLMVEFVISDSTLSSINARRHGY